MKLDLRNKEWIKGDKILWYVIIGLMIASIMVVYSSTGRLAKGNPVFFLAKQVGIISVCLLLIYWLQSVPYKYFLLFAKVFVLGAFVLLIVAKFSSMTVNDTDRWIRIPFIGLTFQPSELAKLAAIIYTARVLSFYQDDDECRDEALKNILIFVGPLIFLIFMDNFSTSLLLGLVCLIMLFVGRVRLKRMAFILGGLFIMVSLVVALAFTPKLGEVWRFPTIKSRVTAFFSGGEESFQAQQSKIAVARGGMLGVGPGNSVQRNFLPHPYSDFIFAIIIEEYGLVGGGVILLLFLIILYRIGVIVRRCTRTFPALLVTGLGLMIVLQAFVNMGVCVGLFPVTGQPLPLVSMGGTSLLFTSAAFGMILSVSHTFPEHGEMIEEPEEKEGVEEDEYMTKEENRIEENVEE